MASAAGVAATSPRGRAKKDQVLSQWPRRPVSLRLYLDGRITRISLTSQWPLRPMSLRPNKPLQRKYESLNGLCGRCRCDWKDD